MQKNDQVDKLSGSMQSLSDNHICLQNKLATQDPEHKNGHVFVSMDAISEM